MKRRATVAGILFLSLVILGMGLLSQKGALSPGSSARSHVLEIALEGVGGEKLRLPFKDKKALLVFFSLQCPSCREEVKKLWTGGKWIGEEVILIVEGERGEAEGFVAEENPPFPVALDPGGAVFRLLGVRHLPAYVLLDSQGRVEGEWKHLEDFMGGGRGENLSLCYRFFNRCFCLSGLRDKSGPLHHHSGRCLPLARFCFGERQAFGISVQQRGEILRFYFGARVFPFMSGGRFFKLFAGGDFKKLGEVW